MEDAKKTVQSTEVDSDRPRKDWDPTSCPWFIFGDDDAAEYDVDKIKKFFGKFKRKNKNKNV